MLLYAIAIQTGLRAGELASLTRGRLFLNNDPPFVTCKAGNTNNKQDARLYLQRDVADLLAAHVTTKAPGAAVFAMPIKTSRMFKDDLADARRAWLDAARGPEDRLRREQSDFLAAVNHEGEVADFHCLRHTCGAWLAQAGNHPKVVQTVMRHSAITLTMDTYGHLFPRQEADAVASLPGMLGGHPAAQVATGTDNRAIVIGTTIGTRKAAKRGVSAAKGGESQGQTGETATDLNMLPIESLGETRHDVANPGESAPHWTRTNNPLIKSQMLCQLS